MPATMIILNLAISVAAAGAILRLAAWGIRRPTRLGA
jgi:hypothetical protein